ncbi:MAG: hypothetical protein ACKPKO_57575, partial [Candidatus Fonsibacter sp.]
VAAEIWHSAPLAEDRPVARVILSSDGSTDADDGSATYLAAWAVAIAFEDDPGVLHFCHFFSGGLGLDAPGALDSGHAEGAGLMWAMAWAVQAACLPRFADAAFTFQYDATYVGDAATGQSSLHEDRILGEQLFGLGAVVREHCRATWEHVKGHSGRPSTSLPMPLR